MTKGKLGQWLKEKWVDTKTGEPCGEGDGVSKSKKYCRPTVRVNESTPKTLKEMTKEEIDEKEREKKRLSNKGKKPSRVKAVAKKGLKVKKYQDGEELDFEEEEDNRKLTDKEYFNHTGIDRRLMNKGPEDAKEPIKQKSPSIALNEDYYKHRPHYNQKVTDEFGNLIEKSKPNDEWKYAAEIDYKDFYTTKEFEDQIIPYIKELENTEIETYPDKVIVYIAESLAKIGFDAEELADKAKLTRDRLYDEIEPEIMAFLQSKNLDLSKINWEKIRKYNEKKYGKRLTKLVRVSNNNPLLQKASKTQVENKVASILEKGRYKDEYEGMSEEQIMVAEVLKGKVSEKRRRSIMRDMRRGKSLEEIAKKNKDILTDIDLSGFKFEKGGELRNKEMINGIINIIKKVKDEDNRKEIAEYMLDDFKKEKIKVDKKDFLKRVNLSIKYQFGGEMRSIELDPFNVDATLVDKLKIATKGKIGEVLASYYKGGAKLDKSDMKCNNPVRSWRGEKKFAVKGCEAGKEKLLHFGDSSMEDYTQHKDKKRRKSFRSRHGCDDKQHSKLTPKHWSCEYLW